MQTLDLHARTWTRPAKVALGPRRATGTQTSGDSLVRGALGKGIHQVNFETGQGAVGLVAGEELSRRAQSASLTKRATRKDQQ